MIGVSVKNRFCICAQRIPKKGIRTLLVRGKQKTALRITHLLRLVIEKVRNVESLLLENSLSNVASNTKWVWHKGLINSIKKSFFCFVEDKTGP